MSVNIPGPVGDLVALWRRDRDRAEMIANAVLQLMDDRLPAPGLNRREAALVEILRGYPGRPLSTQFISQAMEIKFGKEISEEVIRVYICSSRRKVPALKEQIKTIHGYGYEWQEAD